MRVGLFGGSFDPFHAGHRQVADAALREVDRLLVIPAAVSPFKQEAPPAPAEVRYLMAVLGTLDEPRIRVSRSEIDRAGPSYAVDTVMAVQEQHPAAEMVWIAGADQLAGLARWHRAGDLARACRVLVVPRVGFGADDLDAAIARLEEPWRDRVAPLTMPPVDLAATALRARLAAGEWPAESIPRLTALYLERYNPYRSDPGAVAPGGFLEVR